MQLAKISFDEILYLTPDVFSSHNKKKASCFLLGSFVFLGLYIHGKREGGKRRGAKKRGRASCSEFVLKRGYGLVNVEYFDC